MLRLLLASLLIFGWAGLSPAQDAALLGALGQQARVHASGGCSAPTGPSDDFCVGTLASFWTSTTPGSSSIGFGDNGSDYWIEFISPDGNYDCYDSCDAPRITQSHADTNFTITARFLSAPAAAYDFQGFYVEEDSANWIRATAYYTGSALHGYLGCTNSDNTSTRFDLDISGGSAPWLRLTRSGTTTKTYTFEYSTNGTDWTEIDNSDHSTCQQTVTAVGIMAGNTGASTGFTGEADYFEDSTDPITSEDGS